MKAVIEIPESEYQQGIDQKYLQEAVAAVLYYNGKLSEKEACRISGSTRRQFEEVILPQFGLAVLGGTPEDISFEIHATL